VVYSSSETTLNDYLKMKLYISTCKRYNQVIRLHSIKLLKLIKTPDFVDLTTIRTALTRGLQRRYYHNYHFFNTRQNHETALTTLRFVRPKYSIIEIRSSSNKNNKNSLTPLRSVR
jgi:hypothetical protein